MNQLDREHGNHLLHLVASGMLFELQDWIAQGLPLRVAGKSEHQALVTAADFGFHSMVRVLLDQKCWSPEEMADAAEAAALRRNHEVVLLLLDQPGVAGHMTPYEISECISFPVWEKALLMGMPMRGEEEGDRFGDIFARTPARPLLRFYKTYCQQSPGLLMEGRHALLRFVEKGKTRGVAWMIWAGVDPLQPCEESPLLDDAESTCHWAPAVWEAIARERVDFLTMMKLKPDKTQWLALLETAATWRSLQCLDFIIRMRNDVRQIVVELPRFFSDILAQVLHRYSFIFPGLGGGQSYDAAVENIYKVICVLLDLGVRFHPDSLADLHRTRRWIYEAPPEKVARTVSALSAADGEEHRRVLLEWVNKPKFRTILRTCAPRIYEALFGDEITQKAKKRRGHDKWR